MKLKFKSTKINPRRKGQARKNKVRTAGITGRGITFHSPVFFSLENLEWNPSVRFFKRPGNNSVLHWMKWSVGLESAHTTWKPWNGVNLTYFHPLSRLGDSFIITQSFWD
jgi:hypothetical protein